MADEHTLTPANRNPKRARSEVSPLTQEQSKMAKQITCLPEDAPRWAQKLYEGIQGSIGDLTKDLNIKLDDLEKKIKVQSDEIESLKNKNTDLECKFNELEERQRSTHDKLLFQEMYSRRENLIFHGIAEAIWETEDQCKEKVCAYLRTLNVNPGTLNLARVHRIGLKINSNNNKPWKVIVRFGNHPDRQVVWRARPQDFSGTFITQDIPEEIQARRSLLTPILQAAKTMDTYKDNCHIRGYKLVINNITYTGDTLYTLPSDLDPKQICTPQIGAHVFFWGQHSPLSNHHPSIFTVNGTTFTSSEQHYQYQRAIYAGDRECAAAIMKTNNPVQQIQIAKNIKANKPDQWLKTSALHQMEVDLLAKFQQNPELLKFLLETGDFTLVEASPTDTFWGIGVGLNNPSISDDKNWRGKTSLGTC